MDQGYAYAFTQSHDLAAGQTKPTLGFWLRSTPVEPASEVKETTMAIRLHYSVNAEGIDYNTGVAADHVVEHKYTCLR